MKLYVCFTAKGAASHPCTVAATALQQAGYEPEIIAVKGFSFLPRVLQTKKRRHVHELTGNYHVPTLVIDNGTIIDNSRVIADWARKNKI